MKRKRTPTEFLSSRPEFAPQNRARLEVLYSDFAASKQTNPLSFNANVETWTNILIIGTREGVFSDDTLILRSGQKLKTALTWSGVGRPLALSAVLNDLQSQRRERGRKRAAMTFQEFMGKRSKVGRQSWIMDTILMGVRGLSLLDDRDSDSENEIQEIELVIMDNVNLAAKAIFTRFQELTSVYSHTLYDLESFTETFRDVVDPPLSSKDIKVILKYLERDEPILKVSDGIIKFSKIDQPITQTDKQVLNVKITLCSVSSRIKTLEQRLRDLNSEAKKNISLEKHQSRNALILRKHIIVSVLPPLYASEHNLTQLLLRIDSSVSEVEVLKSLKDGSEALKKIIEEGRKITGTKTLAEGVENVMDAVRESLDEYEQVQNVMTEETIGEDIDSEELAKEMLALETEVEIENQIKDDKKKENQIGKDKVKILQQDQKVSPMYSKELNEDQPKYEQRTLNENQIVPKENQPDTLQTTQNSQPETLQTTQNSQLLNSTSRVAILE